MQEVLFDAKINKWFKSENVRKKLEKNSMENYNLGTCIYCGCDVYYEEGASLVKCTACGENIAVASFLNEQIRLQKVQEEAEQAKRDLADAIQAKETAEKRTFQAVSQLENLSAGQKEQKSALQKILSEFQVNKEDRDAVFSLLRAIRGEQGSQGDALTELAVAVMQGQETAEGKLEALQRISEMLQKSQMDIIGLAGLLKTGTEKTNQLISQILLWAGRTDEKAEERIKALQNGSETLRSGLIKINQKIDHIEDDLEDITSRIEGFESRWKQSELNKIAKLYHQAENKQKERKYEEAEGYYRQVIIYGGEDPEVYWRLLLCHYCVEYQRNEKNQLIPTILYPSLDDPRTLQDWQDLQKECRSSKKLLAYYEEQLKPIENIITKYSQLRQKINPQVFVCVKQKEAGHWTSDSDTGSVLYDLITEQGHTVFNSRRVIMPAGESFEPYIIAALLSASLMIVVGTEPEHMMSRWVQNEWTRFQWLQEREKKKNGKTKRRLVCYLKGMNPEEIPKQLHPDHQAIEEDANVTVKIRELLIQTFGKPESQGPKPAEESVNLDDVWDQMSGLLAIGMFSEVTQKYADLSRQKYIFNQPRLHLFALCAMKKAANFEDMAGKMFDLEKEKLFELADKRATSREDKRLLERLLQINWIANGAVKEPEKKINPEQPPEEKKEKKPEPPMTPETTEKPQHEPKQSSGPPVICSLELDNTDARLDRYLENNHLSKSWIRDQNWPDKLVFINDFLVAHLSLKIDLEKPIEDDREEIVWQIFSEDGKAVTSVCKEMRLHKNGGGAALSCWSLSLQAVSWPEGIYSLFVTLNGSTPSMKRFKVVSLSALVPTGQQKQEPPQPPRPDGSYDNPKTGYEKEFVHISGASRMQNANSKPVQKTPPVSGSKTAAKGKKSAIIFKGIQFYEPIDGTIGINLGSIFIHNSFKAIAVQFDVENVIQPEYATIKWSVTKQDGSILLQEQSSTVTLRKGDGYVRSQRKLFSSVAVGTYYVHAELNGTKVEKSFIVVDSNSTLWKKEKAQVQSVKLMVQNRGSMPGIALSLSRSKVQGFGVRINFKKPLTEPKMLLSWNLEKENGQVLTNPKIAIIDVPKGDSQVDSLIQPGKTLLNGMKDGTYRLRVWVNGARPVTETFTVKE